MRRSTVLARLNAEENFFGNLIRGGLAEFRARVDDCRATLAKSEGTGMDQDIATDLGTEVEARYIDLLRIHFPTATIVAEERGVLTPPRPSRRRWLTIDADDGSKQLKRGNLDGVGSMVALVDGERVVVAAIGHASTGQVYLFVGDRLVLRFNVGGTATKLSRQPVALDQTYLLIDEDPLALDPLTQRLLKRARAGGPFYSYYLEHGGISTLLCKLISGKVGALRIGVPKQGDKCWDIVPVAGMLTKLGFVTYALDPISELLVPRQLVISQEVVDRREAIFCFHPEHIEPLRRLGWIT